MRRVIQTFSVAFCLLLALISSVWGANGEEQNFAILKSLDFQKFEKTLEVSMGIEGEYIYQVIELRNPWRLAVDISPVNKILADLYYEINEFGLQGIRIGQFHPYVVRVVFDFSDGIRSYEAGKSEGGIKVIFGQEEKTEKSLAPEKQPRAAEVKEKVQERIPREKAKRESFYNTMIGASVGSYQISSERFQEVYTGSGAIYGLNLSLVLFSYQNLNFDLSFEAKTFSKTGVSTVTLEETKFSMTPISIAARCLLQTKYLIFFIGVGMDSYSYKEESVIYPATGLLEGSTSGSHFEGGVYIWIPQLDFLRIKLFYKSTKALATENDIEVDLGGKEFGVSLAYSFNLFQSKS